MSELLYCPKCKGKSVAIIHEEDKSGKYKSMDIWASETGNNTVPAIYIMHTYIAKCLLCHYEVKKTT